MFNLIKGCLLTTFILLTCFTHAQFKRLNIGDTIPNLNLQHVINYKNNTIRLHDFKGKYVILDFWNHKCLPCITAFPTIDSIQKDFKTDLQILMVNKESTRSTLEFFENRKKIKIPSVPIITNDTILSEYFPAEGYPYHVWLDRFGVIRNITGGYNTTKEHVAKFLSGKKLQLHNASRKKISSYTANKEVFRFIFYSSISHCNRSLHIGSVTGEVVDSGKSIRLAMNCTSILNLFKNAFQENGKFNFSAPYSVDFKVCDPYKYTWPDNKNLLDEWIENHAFNYELIIPSPSAADRYTIMQQDIQRYFGLSACIEYRKVKSMVLRQGNIVKLSSEGGAVVDEAKSLKQNQGESLQLRNITFEVFINHVKSWVIYQYPFFNECSFKGSIDIKMSKEALSPFNLKLFQKEIEAYGLHLVIEEKVIPVLVIRE